MPLNPDGDTLQCYYMAVHEWNETAVLLTLDVKGMHQKASMKLCYLALIFRKDRQEQEVGVMQSACYVRCDDQTK